MSQDDFRTNVEIISELLDAVQVWGGKEDFSASSCLRKTGTIQCDLKGASRNLSFLRFFRSLLSLSLCRFSFLLLTFFPSCFSFLCCLSVSFSLPYSVFLCFFPVLSLIFFPLSLSLSLFLFFFIFSLCFSSLKFVCFLSLLITHTLSLYLFLFFSVFVLFSHFNIFLSCIFFVILVSV